MASRIVSDRRFGEPRTNRELFDLLLRDSWLEAASPPFATRIVQMSSRRAAAGKRDSDVSAGDPWAGPAS